jgi:hypothetical protein
VRRARQASLANVLVIDGIPLSLMAVDGRRIEVVVTS